MSKKAPPKPSDEELHQLSKEQLVEIIKALQEEVARLKGIISKDSKTSSKPPSHDLIKKSEKKKSTQDTSLNQEKRKPGGQPGHQGKTRKGFSRIDRIEILRPQKCNFCGHRKWVSKPGRVETQQVAILVDKPIEIVEYHRYHCQCDHCGKITTAPWDSQIVPGQDLGIRLQAFLGWLGNYGHLPYQKQQEMLWELAGIEIGVGTLVSTNQRVEEAISPSVTGLMEWVKSSQPNLHVDETPWPVKGVKEWLWVFTNRDFCLFRAADTRSRAELEAQLGTTYALSAQF